jgi:apolipoprotein N-acyltransferase
LNREGFQKNKKRISLVLSVILLPIIFSLVTYYTYTEKVDPLNIVIIQPNIDPYNEKFDTPVVEQLEKMCNLAEEKVTKNTDLVVAPETAISEGFYEEDARFMPSVSYLIKRKKEWGIPNLLIGASTARTFEEKNSRASRPLAIGEGFIEFYNTSLLIDEGDDLQFIHKSLLVPGAEIIPFSDYFPFLEELAIHNGGIKGSLGIEKKPKTFVSNDLKISSLICYESTCGQILAKQCKDGAEAVFVITNDGWWKDTPGYKQHMSFSRLRAIESRRYVARAANTGTSCIINQRGDVLQQTDWWVPAVLSGTINKNSELTIYSSFASEIWGALPWSSLIFLIFAFYKLFKKKVLG